MTIDSAVDLRRVSVYLVHKGTGSVGKMKFLDSAGAPIMTITSNADCESARGTVQLVSLPAASRKVLVEVTGTIYVDDFVVN
jgi:hypothetical protein